MINLYLSFDEINRPFKFFNNKDLFKKYGINLVNDIEKCDFILYLSGMGYNYYRKDLEYFWTNDSEQWDFFKREEPHLISFIEKGKKIILYNRSDGAISLSWLFNTKLYKNYHDKIIIFKDYNFKTDFFKEKKEIPLFGDAGGGGHHKYLIQKYFPESLNLINYCTEKIFSEDFYKYDKIKVFTFKFDSYGWLYQNYDKNNDVLNKPIDVMFIKHYRPQLFNDFHRNKIKDILNSYNKYNIETDSCDPHQYLNILAKSKICISAWGMGECVYDDWKGILNNTIILKPDTSYMKDYYGIYDPSNEIIVYFKPDLSNLKEKIEEIISNYPYYLNKVQKAKEYLVNTFTEERHVKDFCNMII